MFHLLDPHKLIVHVPLSLKLKAPYLSMSHGREGDLNLIQLQRITEKYNKKIIKMYAHIHTKRLFTAKPLIVINETIKKVQCRSCNFFVIIIYLFIFFLWGECCLGDTKRIKDVLSLEYFMMSEFVGCKKKCIMYKIRGLS